MPFILRGPTPGTTPIAIPTRDRTLTADGDVTQGVRARHIQRQRTLSAAGSLIIQGAATLTRERDMPEAFGRLNDEPNKFGTFTSARERDLSTVGTGSVGGSAVLTRERGFSAVGHVAKADYDAVNILLTIANEGGPGFGNKYSARIHADGTNYAIKAYQYTEAAGALGIELQVALVDPSQRSAIESAAVFVFEVYDGAVWVSLFNSGQLTGLGFSIASDNNGQPSNNLQVSTNGDVDNKLRMSPPFNTTIFDSERVTLTAADFKPIKDSDGNSYAQDLVPFPGLLLYDLLQFVFVTKLGFDEFKTTIPNYPIRRADFNIGGTWFDGVGGHVGAFVPLIFVRDNVIWIIDSTAPFPAGFGSPAGLGAGDYINAQFTENELDVDGYIVEFADVETDYDYTLNRFEDDEPETVGHFGDPNWTETTRSRTYIDFYKFTNPNVAVRSEKSKEVITTRGMTSLGIATVSTETENLNYDSFGRLRSIAKEHTGLVPNLANPPDFTPTTRTIRSAYTQFLYGPDRLQPVRQILKQTIKETRGLITTDSTNKHLGKDFRQEYSEGFSAGNLREGLDISTGPIETRTETVEQTEHGQFEMRTRAVNFLTDPPQILNSTTDARSGDMSTNTSTGSTNQVIVFRSGVIRATARLGTLAVAELPLKYAEPLARRRLERRKLRRGTITLKGLKLSIGRGTMFEILDRDGFTIGVFVCEGRSVAGSNLGTREQTTRQTVEVSEI